MSAGRLQCKDIPDAVFLAAVDAAPGGRWKMRWDVHDHLEAQLGRPLPVNLVIAKARRLILRGVLHGCAGCTCRGDWHLPAATPGCC